MSIAKRAKTRPTPSAHEAALKRGVETLTTLARLLHDDGENAMAQAGLPEPMAAALDRLALLPDRTTVSQLARSLGCNMGNLSGTLDRLEEAGYIERIVAEADRRARLIRLTAKGRRMVTQMTEYFWNGRVCAALKQMNVQQLEAMTEIITRLNSSAGTADASS